MTTDNTSEIAALNARVSDLEMKLDALSIGANEHAQMMTDRTQVHLARIVTLEQGMAALVDRLDQGTACQREPKELTADAVRAVVRDSICAVTSIDLYDVGVIASRVAEKLSELGVIP